MRAPDHAWRAPAALAVASMMVLLLLTCEARADAERSMKVLGRVVEFEVQLSKETKAAFGAMTSSKPSSSAVKLATSISSNAAAPDNEALLRALDFIGGFSRPIILVTVAANYLDFLENWVAYAGKLGYLDRVLFLAEGFFSHKHCKERWPAQTVRAEQVVTVESLPGRNKDMGYNSPYYNEVVGRRPRYFNVLMNLGVSFLYTDIDVVWLRDPFPFFTGTYDIWMQEDTRVFEGALERFKGSRPAEMIKGEVDHELCTGFMYVRPTLHSKRVVAAWHKKLQENARKKGVKGVNQKAFNEVVWADEGVRLGVLPTHLFASGCIWFENPEREYCKEPREGFQATYPNWRDIVVMIHNNFIKGHDNKVKRFEVEGLWAMTA